MSFINRALASMTRNFGKTLLLLLIVFILGVVISGAISVQQAIINTDSNIRAILPPAVTVGQDWEALDREEMRTGEWVQPDLITLEMIHQIGALPYVRAYDISVEAWMLMSRDLERFTMGEFPSMYWGMDDWDGFPLTGVQSTELLPLNEGIIELTAGRMFTDAEVSNLTYVALISEEFARLNDLHIGSRFTLYDIAWNEGVWDNDSFEEEDMFASRAYDLEVVGIFTPLMEAEECEWGNTDWTYEEWQNRIYVPNPVAIASNQWHMDQGALQFPDDEWFAEQSEDDIWYSNIYILYDASDIPAFRTAVEEIAPEWWTAIDAGDGFDPITSSMDSLTRIASIILYVAIGAAVVILSLLITLFIRERKREIGVYLALGEARGKVIVQMMTEVMVVALIAIVLSLVAGNVLAGAVSESMLRDHLIAAQDPNAGMFFGGGALEQMGFTAEPPSVDEILASYRVSLDASTVAIFFAATVTTVLVATILPMLYIVRLNPKKIML